MWEISNSFQIFGFSCAFATGILLGVGYDFLRGFRKAGHPSVFNIAVSDVLFFLIAAVICFYMELALTAGRVRWYFLIGVFLGFLTERATLSRVFVPCIAFVSRVIRKGILNFSALLRCGLELIEVKMAKILRKSTLIIKKVGKTLKKLLKIG